MTGHDSGLKSGTSATKELTVLELGGVELIGGLGAGARQLVRVRLALVALHVALVLLVLVLLLPLLAPARRHALEGLPSERKSGLMSDKRYVRVGGADDDEARCWSIGGG
jgi:hypothetical protein